MDNNELYCQQKIAVPGSACYYSMLTMPQGQRRRVVAVLAFSAEIQSICLECHDHDVARAKLNFWYEELLAFSRGNASHPVTLQLQTLFAQQPLAYDALLSIIYEAQVRLHTPLLLTTMDSKHLERYHSVWSVLSTQIFEGDPGALKDFSAMMACYFGRMHILEKFFQYVQKNLYYFAALHEGIDLKQLSQHSQFSEELHAFLVETLNVFQQACGALPQHYRASQRFILILAQVMYARVQRLVSAGPQKILRNLAKGVLLMPALPIMNYYYARKYFKQEQRMALRSLERNC